MAPGIYSRLLRVQLSLPLIQEGERWRVNRAAKLISDGFFSGFKNCHLSSKSPAHDPSRKVTQGHIPSLKNIGC